MKLTKEFVAAIKRHSLAQFQQLVLLRQKPGKAVDAQLAAFDRGQESFLGHLINAGLVEIIDRPTKTEE